MFAGVGFDLPRMLGFDECFQVIKACRPEYAVLLNPGVNSTQRFGIELVDAMASLAMLADQVCAAKESEVLRYRWTRDRERAGNLPGRLAAASQEIKDCAARGVGKGLKCGFTVSRGRICNRTVTHNS